MVKLTLCSYEVFICKICLFISLLDVNSIILTSINGTYIFLILDILGLKINYFLQKYKILYIFLVMNIFFSIKILVYKVITKNIIIIYIKFIFFI